MLRASTLLVVSVAVASGCAADLFKSKSSGGGRTGLLPAGTRVSIELERRRDPREKAARAVFLAEVEGAPLRGATLLHPDGTVLPLVPAEGPAGGAAPDARPRWVAAVEDAEGAILTHFPNGAYTFEIVLEDGSPRTVTVFVHGAFPDYPRVAAPLDGAAEVPLDVRFEWAGAADRFDLGLIDETTGVQTTVADGKAGLTALAAAPLEPSRGYVLELSAEDGPPGELVEFESTTVVRFRTAAE